MNNIKILKNEMEISNAIIGLGDFVVRNINGYFENEYDLINPCGYYDVISSNLFPSEGKFRQAVSCEDSVQIIMNNGDIVEICKSHRKYYCEETIANELKKLSSLGQLKFQEVSEHGGKTEITFEEDVDLNKAMNYINYAFCRNGINCKNISFTIYSNKIIFDEKIQEDFKLHYKKVFVQTFTKKIFRDTKIIQSNKFKVHMNAHKNDFIIPYQNLINYATSNHYFENLKGDFIEMVVEFPFNIGYTSLCKTTDYDEVVYAKRKNRDVYTRFTLDGKSKLTNKCAMVLSKGKGDNADVYYLITMFPGEYLVKEPQDRNIKSEEEKNKSIEFWNGHALVFKPKDVDLTTISYNCPFSINI